MRIVYFTQSIISDWNNGNAHFLRGIVAELLSRGIEVRVKEPIDGWSLTNLKQCYGDKVVSDFRENFPLLSSEFYDPKKFTPEKEIGEAQLVIVHEWNEPEIVKKIGEYRNHNSSMRLLFHDTHHRAVSGPGSISSLDLSNYDGVLAFGESLRQIYLKEGWIQRVWTWHEAADIRVFKPIDYQEKKNDIVWIGNWGDEERSSELHDYIFEPVRQLQLKCNVYGVRYSQNAIDDLKRCNIQYKGWLPNYKVPEIFAESRLTIHVPRRPYVKFLQGIPTIRIFEALACGIPLITSRWYDSENIFTEGKDYIMVSSGKKMMECIRLLLNDMQFANELRVHGRETILRKHTCAHRVDQLLEIYNQIKCK